MFKQYVFFTCCLLCISLLLHAQCLTKEEVLKKIQSTENDNVLSDRQKLSVFYSLKKNAENCAFEKDSVYAWIFLKLGKYEYLCNKNYESAIKHTEDALAVNNYSAKGSSAYLNINACFNLASSYGTSLLYKKASLYYDTVIFLCRNIIDTNTFALDSRTAKSNIYFLSGDYQKAVEESIKGIYLAEVENNLNAKASFLNMEAQSLLFQNNIDASLPIAFSAADLSKQINNAFQLATAYKTIALAYERKHFIDSAKYYYQSAITNRLKTNEYANIGADYNDFGNFYHGLKDYGNAAKCYQLFLLYANKISDPVSEPIQISLAYLNIGENYFSENNYKQAELYYLKATNSLKLNLANIYQNPSSQKILLFGSNAEFIIGLMSNKTKLLLQQYKNTQQKNFLNACLKTALVTDTVINKIRHEHLGEQSKIYWRDKTSRFYANAIEACYLSNNAELAFYFIEKSRAMLLSDKLNELNAISYLPQQEAKKEENYQIKIVELEQQLSALDADSKQFQTLQLQLLNTKDNFEYYIKSLEQKHPLYYQYKYADEVPSLNELQQYLNKNNQSFVHYFFSDTLTYILCITQTSIKFIRLTQQQFNKESFSDFINLCANKEALNNHYNSFIKLSNSIYTALFKPLQLVNGRIIICTDNALIPFEALNTDARGKIFLLQHYSFDYVYSASSFLKKFNNPAAKGNFAGFAPVSFAKHLDVAELKNSAAALNACSDYYKSNKLFTNISATRSNFFNYASSYSIINIFSHARADTTGNEPVLFMQDSLIHLSELQLLDNPATKLVLLSACQTNVGKAAAGEGIYSLARGFAAAGIPSVSATLWEADEQSIYAITEKFNEYLAEGMNKDEALQKAKLYFIQHNSSDKMLPYYWANMVMIGNTDAIDFSAPANNYWWIIGLIATVLIITFFILYKKFRQQKS